MADSTGIGAEVRLRWDIRPGDIGAVVSLHGVLYAAEYGFDSTFEGYVAGTLGHFGAPIDPLRERLWLAEVADRVVGSIALIKHTETMAQLRWFLVDPAYRGRGIGKRLVQEAVQFAREAGYGAVFLETLKGLTAAAALYHAAGFKLTAAEDRTLWGRAVTDQRYELAL